MKVRDLIEQLTEMDPELDIVLQKDSEGNGYAYAGGADPDCILKREDYENRVFDCDWTAADAGMEEYEWEEFKKENPRVVVIYP